MEREGDRERQNESDRKRERHSEIVTDREGRRNIYLE